MSTVPRSRGAAVAVAGLFLVAITGLSYGRLRPMGPGAPSADLSLVKADTPDPVSPGGVLAYTLTVTNAGPDRAVSVTVTDVLPAGLTGVTASGPGWTCADPVEGLLTCTRESLDVATAPAILVTGIAPAGGPLASSASAVSATSDPVAGNNAAVEDTRVAPADASADLSIDLSDAPDPANAGSNITYTVTVINAGPDAAADVTVTDTLPSGVSIASGSGEGWTCDPPVSGHLTCTSVSLPVGAAPTLTIVLTAPAAGPATNGVAVSSTTPDPLPGNNAASATTVIKPVSDVSLMVTDAPDPVAPGGTITYSFTVTNNGPSPVEASALLQFTGTLTNVLAIADNSWPDCGNSGPGTRGCYGVSLGVGESASMTVTGTAPGQGTVVTSGVAYPLIADPNPSNNTVMMETAVAANADLALTMADTPDPVLPGGLVTYTLAVANNGPSNAVFVSVTDTLPAGLTSASAHGSGWSCAAPDAGAITCTRQFLAPSVAPAITITGFAPASGPLTNTATISSTIPDSNPANSTDTETTTIPASGELADLFITKTDESDPAGAGLPIRWTLEVANAGPAAANHVVVTDTLPPGVLGARGLGTGWSCRTAAGAVECTRASLAVGPASAITITAVAPVAAGDITNLAEVASDALDPFPEDNVAAENTVVIPVHDLAVLKVRAPAKVRLDGSGASSAARIKVQIQNRSPHDETIVDEAMLAGLVHLTADSLGDCSDLQGTLVTGSPQEPLPRTLRPKQKLIVWFEVAFSTACVNDPAKSSARDPGHEDYQYLVIVDHAALDGEADTHTVDDVCPRSVDPPFATDPYPDGSIKDKGCGKEKRDGTSGDPILTDVWVRP